MEKQPEFAEEYTKQERVRFVVLGSLAGAVMVGASKLFFFPWLRGFSEPAHCQSIMGVNGSTVLFYGMFVGLPLLSAVLVGCTVGRRGVTILRQGQVPPESEKVFRPTRIVRGRMAKASGFFHTVAVLPLLALAAWGFFQAAHNVNTARLPSMTCTANFSLGADMQLTVTASRLVLHAGQLKR